MGGVDVGNIVGVDYGRDATDKNIHVRLSISVEDARRIRKDSVATIEGKGLLGDKMIVITVGTSGQAMLPAGSAIPSKSAEDITQMMSRLSNISSQVKRSSTIWSGHEFVLRRQIPRRYSQLRGCFGGHFGLHRPWRRLRPENCCTIPASRPICRTWSRNLEQTSAELEHTTTSVNEVLARVNTGPGLRTRCGVWAGGIECHRQVRQCRR